MKVKLLHIYTIFFLILSGSSVAQSLRVQTLMRPNCADPNSASVEVAVDNPTSDFKIEIFDSNDVSVGLESVAGFSGTVYTHSFSGLSKGEYLVKLNDTLDELPVNLETIDADVELLQRSESVCMGTVAEVVINESQANVDYQLFNITENSLVGTAVSGDGNAIFLKTDAINEDQEYLVRASACGGTELVDLNTRLSFTALQQDLDVSFIVSSNSLCEGEKIELEVPNAKSSVSYRVYDKLDGQFLSDWKVGEDGNSVKFDLNELSNTVQLQLLIQTEKCGDYFSTHEESVIVDQRPMIVSSTLQLSSSNICEGETAEVSVSNSNASYSYVLVNEKSLEEVSVPVAGNGGDLILVSSPLDDDIRLLVKAFEPGKCESYFESSFGINVNIVSTPFVLNENQEFCTGELVSDLKPQGDDLEWYDEVGTLLDGSEVLQNGKYVVKRKSGQCLSEGVEVAVSKRADQQVEFTIENAEDDNGDGRVMPIMSISKAGLLSSFRVKLDYDVSKLMFVGLEDYKLGGEFTASEVNDGLEIIWNAGDLGGLFFPDGVNVLELSFARRQGVLDCAPILLSIDTGDFELTAGESAITCGASLAAMTASLQFKQTPFFEISTERTLICNGDEITISATNLRNAGVNPVVEWYINDVKQSGSGLNFTFDGFNDGDIVKAKMTPDITCPSVAEVYSNELLMEVGNKKSRVELFAIKGTGERFNDEISLCSGDILTISAETTTAGDNPSYTWYRKKAGESFYSEIIGLFTSSKTYIGGHPFADGDSIFVQVNVSTGTCQSGFENKFAISNKVRFNVNGLAPTVQVESNKPVYCKGESATLIARGDNFRENPFFIWTVDGTEYPKTSDSVFIVDNLQKEIDVSVKVELNGVVNDLSCFAETEKESNIATLQIGNLNNSIEVNSDDARACVVGELMTFDANVSGYANPTYQWRKNGADIIGETDASFSSTSLIDNDLINVVVSEQGGECLLSSEPVNVSIGQDVLDLKMEVTKEVSCVGDLVSVIAHSSVDEAFLDFQWSVNGTLLSNETSNTLTRNFWGNGDEVQVTVSSSEPCVLGSPITSEIIVINVKSRETRIKVQASKELVCSGESVTLEIVGDDLPDDLTYLWFKDGQILDFFANERTFDVSNIQSSGKYYAELRKGIADDLNCLDFENIIMDTAQIDILPSEYNFELKVDKERVCSGDRVNLTLESDLNLDSFQFEWYLNGNLIPGVDESSYSIPVATSSEIKVKVSNSGLACFTALERSVNVDIGDVEPTISIDANNTTVCEGETVSFTAQVSDAGDAPQYVWMINGVEIAKTYSPTFETADLIDQDQVSVKVISSLSCDKANEATSEILNITIDNLPMEVDLLTDEDNYCLNESATFTADVRHGGDSPAYQWFVNGNEILGHNAPTYEYFTNAEGQAHIEVVVSSSRICSPGEKKRAEKTIGVGKKKLELTISPDKESVCSPTDVVLFTAVLPSIDDQVTINWWVNGIVQKSGTDKTFVYGGFDHGDIVEAEAVSTSSCALNSRTVSNEIVINNIPKPVLSLNVPNIEVCEGGFIDLSQYMEVDFDGGTFTFNSTESLTDSDGMFDASSLSAGEVRKITVSYDHPFACVKADDLEFDVNVVVCSTEPCDDFVIEGVFGQSPSCGSSPEGKLSINLSGGVAYELQYKLDTESAWSPILSTNTNNILISDLIAGTYQIRGRLKKAVICEWSEIHTFYLQPLKSSLIDNVVIGHTTVETPGIGFVEVRGKTFEGGVLRDDTFDFHIEDKYGNVLVNQTGLFENLRAGEYVLSITSLTTGCISNDSTVVIEERESLNCDNVIFDFELSKPQTCQAFGEINFVASGGSGDYEYRLYKLQQNNQWQEVSPYQTQPQFTIEAGTYKVELKDLNYDCTKLSQEVQVAEQRVNLVLNWDVISSSTCGKNDGSFRMNQITGGVSSSFYSWKWINKGDEAFTPFIEGTVIENVGSEVQYLVLKDEFTGCTKNVEITVGGPEVVYFELQKVDPTCGGGGDDGKLTVNIDKDRTNTDWPYFVTIIKDDTEEVYVRDLMESFSKEYKDLSSGQYTVRIVSEDSGNSCPSQSNIEIGGAYVNVDFTMNVNLPYCSDDEAEIIVGEIIGDDALDYKLTLLNDQGEVVIEDSFQNDINFINYVIDDSQLSEGDYSLSLSQEQSGCVISEKRAISISRPENPLRIEELVIDEKYLPFDSENGNIGIVNLVDITRSGEGGYRVKLKLEEKLTSYGSEQAGDIIFEAQLTDHYDLSKDAEATFRNLHAGEYSVILNDTSGCVVSENFVLEMTQGIWIPNIFTPNGDRYNNVFEIGNMPRANEAGWTIVITNRAGRTVFKSTDYKLGNEWTGEGQPEGIYFYELNAGDHGNFTGWVELFRGDPAKLNSSASGSAQSN
ncbi:T9SS type B sorting domain-containing protein [Aureibacter tunicatorum]|uniref:Gliding motility-associated-like protein n=1 Tax=Aureibacter tunicatorum TaxID=866807 RepID=A0AAE3XSQ5_9BACT|nr:gliding motility-associated C-terminal domain-containing protein [Aureibacter tunicatorum]MDR6240889.1 gliding motility-associated-like protein [Aureibacter tunicatorum]BDD03669.1 hypothetical protein AUTU_11520 [Aureibacter tunicatorum]